MAVPLRRDDRAGLIHNPAMRPDAAFIAALERSNIHPLWDRYQRITPVAPEAKDAPMHWRWRDLEPFTERAATEVAIEDVERRALILANPAFGGETVTTSNLIGAFTVLEPGDKAVPHRHTAAAIRFATRAEGAFTIVNGRRCAMHEGDLVLTPPMCWHGHINQGERRTVWFDAANMPAICALDASFFEPGTRQDERFWEVSDAGSEAYRFPGDEVRKALDAAPVGEDLREDLPLHAQRRLGDAHARPLPGAGDRQDPAAQEHAQRGVPRGRGRGPLHRRRRQLRVVAARRIHHPALDLGQPRAARRGGGPVHGHRPRHLRAARAAARRSTSESAEGIGARRPARRGSAFPYAAAAASSTISSFPASCTALWCARRTPMPNSEYRSQGAAAPGIVVVLTGADMAADERRPDASRLGALGRRQG